MPLSFEVYNSGWHTDLCAQVKFKLWRHIQKLPKESKDNARKKKKRH